MEAFIKKGPSTKLLKAEKTKAIAGFIRYFSRETHTIYVPKLTMYFDKSSFNTGTLDSIDLDSYTVYTKQYMYKIENLERKQADCC